MIGGKVLNGVWDCVYLTSMFIYYLYLIIFTNLTYTEIPNSLFDKRSRIQLYHLAITFKLWYEPHYRASSYQTDLKDNLRNVCIPLTGIPLSIFCCNFWVALFFVMYILPKVCLGAAIYTTAQNLACALFPDLDSANPRHLLSLEEYMLEILNSYQDYYFHPTDWFSLWRLNCSVAALHSHASQSTDYRHENKWTFLTEGRELGIAVSPFISDLDSIVCKHRNMEGGLGIYFFENASAGGDWIIQKRLTNSDWLKALLPEVAPLSTMRVITSSEFDVSDVSKTVSSDGTTSKDVIAEKYVKIRTSVLRLGRKNASTDHAAVFFDCCNPTNSMSNDVGKILNGSSNAHWYLLSDIGVSFNKAIQVISTKLYLKSVPVNEKISEIISVLLLIVMAVSTSIFHCVVAVVREYVWLAKLIKEVVSEKDKINKILYALITRYELIPKSPRTGLTSHPDVPESTVTGKLVPQLDEALQLVRRSHAVMMPSVPLVGWDVAFTPQGVCLLEVNLSCNFFQGSFDSSSYIDFVDLYFTKYGK